MKSAATMPTDRMVRFVDTFQRFIGEYGRLRFVNVRDRKDAAGTVTLIEARMGFHGSPPRVVVRVRPSSGQSDLDLAYQAMTAALAAFDKLEEEPIPF